MNPHELIHKYYADNATLEHILLRHTEVVMHRALQNAVSSRMET